MHGFADRAICYLAGAGAQPCCREGTYYHHKSIELDPGKASDHAKLDAFIMTRIEHFWEKSGKRYGAVKIWHDLLEERTVAARCTVVRLMKSMGFQGLHVGRSKPRRIIPLCRAPKTR